MLLEINIALLALGTIGALAAFGGETWRKSDAPFLKRVTRRGWVALPCLVMALALGISKELVANHRSALAAKEAARVQSDLQAKLESSQQRLQEAENRLLTAVEASTAEIPRVIDNPYYETLGPTDGVVRSSKNQSPLFVYGGEIIEYDIHGDGEEHPELIAFNVGERTYRLSSRSGSVHVIGTQGSPMSVRLVYPSDLRFAMKMALMSALRSRPLSGASSDSIH